MDSEKGKAKNAFAYASNPLQTTKSETPDMIKNHRNKPKIRPPMLGYSIDKQLFNQQWDHQIQQHQQTNIDPFDAIDEKRHSLAQEFNNNNKSRGQELE